MRNGTLSLLAALVAGLATGCNDPVTQLFCAAGGQMACFCPDGAAGFADCDLPNTPGVCVCGDDVVDSDAGDETDAADTGETDSHADDTSTDDASTDTDDGADTAADTLVDGGEDIGADTDVSEDTAGDASDDGDADATDTTDARDAIDSPDAPVVDPACPDMPAPRDRYLGCEFWSVDLPITDDPFSGGPEHAYGVAIANPGGDEVDVHISAFTEGVDTPARITVGAGSTEVVELPRQDVSDTGITARSIRIRSTGHVAVQQFNPFDGGASASADGSLLLPVRSLGSTYRAVTTFAQPMVDIPGLVPQRAFVTVVGVTEADTTVSIRPTVPVQDGGSISGWAADEERVFTLGQGDVLNLAIATPSGSAPYDATGTLVHADGPVAVFSGHEQATAGHVGEDGTGDLAGFADRLEEQLAPVSAWGMAFVAPHSPPRGEESDTWLVLAASDGTTLTTTPSTTGIHGLSMAAGEYEVFEFDGSFVVSASEPVLLSRFTVGKTAWGVAADLGDPALTLVRPVTDYSHSLIAWAPTAPDDVAQAWLTVVSPHGAAVTHNGAPIEGDTVRIGSWDVHYAAADAGTNALSAGAPIGAILTTYSVAAAVDMPVAGAE